MMPQIIDRFSHHGNINAVTLFKNGLTFMINMGLAVAWSHHSMSENENIPSSCSSFSNDISQTCTDLGFRVSDHFIPFTPF